MARVKTERALPAPAEGPASTITRLSEPVDLFEALVTGDFSGCDFYGAKLPLSRILRSDLSRAELAKTDLAGSVLAGSSLDGVRGATALRRITISSDQVIPLALALFASQRIDISDEI